MLGLPPGAGDRRIVALVHRPRRQGGDDPRDIGGGIGPALIVTVDVGIADDRRGGIDVEGAGNGNWGEFRHLDLDRLVRVRSYTITGHQVDIFVCQPGYTCGACGSLIETVPIDIPPVEDLIGGIFLMDDRHRID